MFVCKYFIMNMAVFILIFCVTLSLCGVVYSYVPVLLWESSIRYTNNIFSAMCRISSEEFHRYVLKPTYTKKPYPLIVLFLEESLSVEDFSWKDLKGQGCFPNLQKLTETAANVTFLPSVQNPMEAIMRLSALGYNLEYGHPNKTEMSSTGCGKLFIVNMTEDHSDEDRYSRMRSHDKQVSDIYTSLQTKCNRVFAILSGQRQSWAESQRNNRTKRKVESISNTTSKAGFGFIIYQDIEGVALVISKSAPTLSYKGKDVVLGNNTDTTVVTGDSSKPPYITLTVKVDTGHQMVFNFDNRSLGYWSLQTLTLIIGTGDTEFVLKPSVTIEAPIDWSFYSGHGLHFTNKTVTLKFSDLQLQPFFLNPGSKAFGEAVDAIPFMTEPIWSGILVTFLFIIITSWGIYMIMNIRTMDKFEDPKSKTISVSAIE